MLVVRANTMSFEAASPQLTQRLLDLLNERITPVVQSRGTVGEGDLGPFTNVGAAMVGAGNAYYRGVRMPAAEALRQAGLEPLAPFGADDSELREHQCLRRRARRRLLLYDAREALSWADLIYAIDLNGMNSSVSPLSQPVQANRPFKWLNWDAARVLEMLKGSYLFDRDDKRIIQDPESLRASSIRQGSAWQAWAQLRDDVLIQMNSSDHNPAVRVGASPADSWELEHAAIGAVLRQGQARAITASTASSSRTPTGIRTRWPTRSRHSPLRSPTWTSAVAQRMLRFTNTFFTVISPSDEVAGRARTLRHLTQGSEIDAAR